MANDIISQREQIQSARQAARAEVQKQLQPLTTQQVLRSEKGLEGYQRRQAIARNLAAQERAISQVEADFERQVAKASPSEARPEYLKEAASEARGVIGEKVAGFEAQIAAKQEQLAQVMENGISHDESERYNRLRDDINKLQQRMGVWNILNKSDVDVAQQYFSGELEYQQDKLEAHFNKAAAKKSWAKSQGFSNYQQYENAYREQQKQLAALGFSNYADYEKARQQQELAKTKAYGEQIAARVAAPPAPTISAADLQKEATRQKFNTLGFKDINWSETFAPTPIKKTSEGVYLTEPAFTAQQYVETQAGKALNWLGGLVEPLIPSGKAKDVLTKKYDVRVTDVAKFGLFSPAMQTTPQIVSQGLREGWLTAEVPSKTRFISTISDMPSGTSRIRTLSETEIGKQKLFGVSQQGAVQSGNKMFYGGNQVFVVRKIGRGKVEITSFETLGKSQLLGQARKVVSGKNVQVAYPVGQGTAGKVFFRETAKKAGKFGSALKNIGASKTISSEGVLGFTKSTGGGYSVFVGKTGEEFLVKGNKLIMSGEPNIAGIIMRRAVQQPSFFSVSTSGGKGILGGTAAKTISTTAQKTIGGQVGGLVGAAKQVVFESLPKQTNLFTAAIKPAVDILSSKQSAPPILAPVAPTATGEDVAQIPKLAPKVVESPKFRQKPRVVQSPFEIPAPAISEIPRISEIPAFRTPQRTKQTPRTSFPTPTIPRIKPAKIPTLFKPSKSNINLFGKLSKERFSAFGRRFGKDIGLGIFSSQKRAEKKLQSFLTGSLGRSGFITQNGKRIKSRLLSSPIFRPSKREPLRVVQKAEFSLSSYPERTEIQLFRKKNRKRKRKLSWFR